MNLGSSAVGLVLAAALSAACGPSGTIVDQPVGGADATADDPLAPRDASPVVDGRPMVDAAPPGPDARVPIDAGSTPDASRPPERPRPPPMVVPAPPRLVAVGDFHGDLQAARAALRMAGAIDNADRWVGGRLVVVQVGDQLDRGDDEQAILDLLERLADAAHAAGGAVYVLLGNHETMNVEFDFRYVTAGGWADFASIPYDPNDPVIRSFPASQRGRVAAFRPGGPYARVLADHNLIMQVGDTLFVHGGLLPQHVQYGLDDINRDVRDWMLHGGEIPAVITGDDSPVWTRRYSDTELPAECALLEQVLDRTGARRMVVAHTVQELINSACDGQVWRIDVGMSSYYGGIRSVLEIVGDQVRVID